MIDLGEMNSKIQIRRMTASDLAFANSLRALAGWNQTRSDWQRLLAHEPAGCFVAEWEAPGTQHRCPVGTATTTRYGSDLAWIGMVLVHPDYRRRGIGLALLQRCLKYLQDLPCIKLDATPLGKALYEQWGFREEWALTRWEGTCALPPLTARVAEIQPWEGSHAPAVEELDRQAFGTSRRTMLEKLANQSRLAVTNRSGRGKLTGYGILREGARALYLGPIVAASPEAGASLVMHLASHTNGQTVFWDIPDSNIAAVELAKRMGLKPQRQLLRMFCGQNNRPGNPLYQFAIADPAMG